MKISENALKGVALLAAHEVGHVLAALALGMDIDYVKLGIRDASNPQVKLGFSLDKSDYKIEEKICFFSASQTAIDILLIEYSGSEKEKYKWLLESHFDDDEKNIEEIFKSELKSLNEKHELYIKACHLVDNVFLSYGHLLHVFIDKLMDKEILTGVEIKRLSVGCSI